MSDDEDDWKKEVQKSNPGMNGRWSKTGKFVKPGNSGKGEKVGKTDRTGKSGRSTITGKSGKSSRSTITGKPGKSGTTGKEAWVTRSEDGWTIVSARGAENGHFRTQKEAIDGARKIIKNSGGGELRIYGKNGAIRDTRNITPDERQPPTG